MEYLSRNTSFAILRGENSKSLRVIQYLYSFTVHFVIVHCLKPQLMHYALKYTLKHNHSLKH